MYNQCQPKVSDKYFDFNVFNGENPTVSLIQAQSARSVQFDINQQLLQNYLESHPKVLLPFITYFLLLTTSGIGLWKNSVKKEKIVVTSIFSFSHIVSTMSWIFPHLSYLYHLQRLSVWTKQKVCRLVDLRSWIK